MKRIVFFLNKTYISFLHIISFLAFLSFQIKLLSLSILYDTIINSTELSYIIIIVFSVISLILTRLLVRLLQKAQQCQLD